MPQPKRILITGCSSGFGQLVVPHLLEQGHHVLAGVRGGDARLRQVLGAEVARYPERLRGIDLHLDQPATLERAREAVERHFGGELDVLVNNAGFGLFGTLEDTSEAELREQFEVNFFGPVLLARALLPALVKARGRVINVSSAAGRMAFPGFGIYCATKHALEAHTEGLRYELGLLDVQVALLEPGSFRTGFAKVGKRVAQGTSNPSSRSAEQTRQLVAVVDKMEARLADPAPVVRKLISLIDRRRIPLRNLVGFDARLSILIENLIPDRLRVWLFTFTMRKIMRFSAPSAR